LTNLSAVNSPAPPDSWGEIARVCRRICLLRERGDAAEAGRLEAGTLANLLTAPDLAASAGERESRLHAIFTAETERVANALCTAELVAPLLAALGSAPNRPPAVASVASLAGAPKAKPVRPRPAPADIAGFIDEMIAQERAS
jgi:hypothetical protein